MKSYKTMDDIDREAREREEKELKEKVTKGLKEVMGNVFPKKKPKKRRVLLKWLGFIFLFLLMITLILGLVWVLRALIKSLFFGG